LSQSKSPSITAKFKHRRRYIGLSGCGLGRHRQPLIFGEAAKINRRETGVSAHNNESEKLNLQQFHQPG
ncbi:MAG: hypothetical protein JXR89_05305, partial [Deltaproteobacteria bacterium]|nr:hypothetical protein [Deltaproteobacteria bacterium]